MKQVLIALFALAPLLAFADVKADFVKIDASLKTCLDNPENYSTYGMNTCLDAGYKAADVELNRVYSNAVTNLKKRTGEQISDEGSAETLRRLVKAERAWITFRDADSELSGIEMLGGTGESQVVIQSLYDMTKARALEINDVLNTNI